MPQLDSPFSLKFDQNAFYRISLLLQSIGQANDSFALSKALINASIAFVRGNEARHAKATVLLGTGVLKGLAHSVFE
jgi:hypothetical protein